MKHRILFAGLALVGLAACGAEDGAEDAAPMEFQGETVEAARTGWPEGLGARIDSANTAYMEGRYQDAADIFRRTTETNPHIGAGWFGLHMAETALGNTAAADSALARAEDLTPGLGSAHDTAAAGMPAMPPNHPTLPAGEGAEEAGGDATDGGEGDAAPLPEGH